MAEVVVQDSRRSNEGPTVGMQLGRGHVNFSEESALESREWQAELDPLEDCGVHEEEGLFRACVIVDSYGFAFPTRLDRHVCIMFPPKNSKLLIGLAFLIGLYIFVRGYFGSFSQEFSRSPMIKGFVFDRRKRVRCNFGSGHLDKKAKEGEKKGRRKTRP